MTISDSRPARKPEINILLLHAESMASELLLRALKRQARFRVTVCAPGAEATDLAKSSKPDIALVEADANQAAGGGFHCLRQLRAQAPGTRCIVLLNLPDKQAAIDAFRAGARGVFCPSQSDFRMLCKCIDRVFAGQIWIRNHELEHLIEALTQCPPARLLHRPELQLLSNRERQVVSLLAEGLTNREIARALSLSEHTVKNYLFKIFDKVAVSSRVELVLFAMQCADQLESPAATPQPQSDQVAA
jgi:DNA-binding NarL/FixJ family response regulator